ncbi:unnamed protein product [Alopecurus aequalis]
MDSRDLQDMAIKLGDMLGTEGKKEREEWDKLHGVLGRIAGYLSIADKTMSTEALLLKLKQRIGAPNEGSSKVEDLLVKIMGILEETIKAEKADASRAIQLLKDLIMLVAKELDMFPLCDSIHTEMIQEKTFYGDKVKHIVKGSAELSVPNAPYTVLSIVGAQSSGKSYLLNQLFGTDFPVMNAREGRPSILVLDVEGFDGRERGQDTIFERQAALFALTTSDFMMVNMSVHDIGREQGGGTPLFKTIFQERRKLSPGLTKIIVVLRYYDGETPVDILEQDIMESLEGMWRSVDVGSSETFIFKDYIEVKVVALPEKNSPGFRKDVRNLRKLISESTLDHSRSARIIPATSFSESSKLLWDQIKENKRLDLPSHKVLISIVYCQEMVEESMEYFASHKDYELLRTLESPRGFKEASDKLLESSISKYDHDTDMYDAAIREKEREKLKHRINMILTKYSRQLILKIRQNTSDQFKSDFVTNLKTMEESGDLAKYQNEILKSYREKFSNLCEDLKLFDLVYLHKICLELQEELQAHASYKILGMKEERAREELESARQRNDENVQVVLDKLKEMQLEEQRLKEEIDREREEQKKERKRAWEEAASEHQNLLEEQDEKNKLLQEEVQKQEAIIKELEKKQNKGIGGCTIL